MIKKKKKQKSTIKFTSNKSCHLNINVWHRLCCLVKKMEFWSIMLVCALQLFYPEVIRSCFAFPCDDHSQACAGLRQYPSHLSHAVPVSCTCPDKRTVGSYSRKRVSAWWPTLIFAQFPMASKLKGSCGHISLMSVLIFGFILGTC